MKSLLTIALIVAALLWSGLAWAMHALAGAGPETVYATARLFLLPPEAVQWLADLLALAGPAIQWVVVIGWLLGMGLLLAVGMLAPRAMRTGGRLAQEGLDAGRAMARGERPTLDPAIRDAFRRK